MLRKLWTQLRSPRVPATEPSCLVSADTILRRWKARGGSAEEALALTRGQIRGLVACVEDDTEWQRLQTLVWRTGDPWNADDWPAGFDPLVLCAPLCQHVAFECKLCPVGRAQQNRSCADPSTGIARVLSLVLHGKRVELLGHLARLNAHLGDLEAAR